MQRGNIKCLNLLFPRLNSVTQSKTSPNQEIEQLRIKALCDRYTQGLMHVCIILLIAFKTIAIETKPLI